MTNRALKRNRTATILIPVIIIILYTLRDYFIRLVSGLPPCPVYSMFHLYCPACGNTRCVKTLLHGDLLLALHYNVSPLIVSIFFLLAYIELAFRSFGKPISILPRKLSFYLILIAVLVLYLIIRNFIPGLAPE